MTITRTVSIFILTMMFVSNTALAESEKLVDKLSKGKLSVTAQVKGCDDDAKQYCPGLSPKSQKVFMCLMAYETQLSDACKVGITEAAMSIKMGMAAIDYSIRACEKDADKHCLDVQAGKGLIIACLRKHETNVSKACVSALKETGLWNFKGN